MTPDAERTMNTFLGISAFLSPDDIDEALVASAAITYCEGYLWDTDIAKAAIRRDGSGTRSGADRVDHPVRLVLRGPSPGEWLDLLSDQVDLVFANESEIGSLFGDRRLRRSGSTDRRHGRDRGADPICRGSVHGPRRSASWSRRRRCPGSSMPPVRPVCIGLPPRARAGPTWPAAANGGAWPEAR
ncbi:MAG: hypothetical protein R2695_11830 [Acidimicrobiales bacterium]